MGIEWWTQDDGIKNHALIGPEHWGTEAPCTVYEKIPVSDPQGKPIPGLYSAWIRLNNPGPVQLLHDRDGQRGHRRIYRCLLGSERRGRRVHRDRRQGLLHRRQHQGIFANTTAAAPMNTGNTWISSTPWWMPSSNCKKPVICRVNGMRVAGGQEIGMACDLTMSSDLAIFGQAGPRHGSAPDGGSTDFLPWLLSMEDAMWNCISCEMWSAYKMKAQNPAQQGRAGAEKGRPIYTQSRGDHRQLY